MQHHSKQTAFHRRTSRLRLQPRHTSPQVAPAVLITPRFPSSIALPLAAAPSPLTELTGATPQLNYSSPAAQQLDAAQLYTHQLYSPPRCIGPVRVSRIPGSGLGLIATSDLRTGDLIMSVPALAITYDTEGSIPTTADLTDQLTNQSQSLTDEQIRWLELLAAERPNEETSGQAEGRGSVGGWPWGRGTRAADAADAAAAAEGRWAALCDELQALVDGTWTSELYPGRTNTHTPHNPGSRNSETASSPSQSPPTPAQHSSPQTSPHAGVNPQAAPTDTPTPHAPMLASQPVDKDSLSGVTMQGTVNGFSGAGNGGDGPGSGVHVLQPGVEGAGIGARGLSTDETGGDTHDTPTQQLGAGVGVGQLSPTQVQSALACNVLGEASEDVAVCALREQEPRMAYLGLWPEYALINHSCAPNTVHLMVGGTLLVRACRPILAGEELTACYLGAGRWGHVSARRAALRQQWGFLCQCERCTLEQSLFPTTQYAEDKGVVSSARRLPWSVRVSQWVLDRVFGRGRYLLGVSSDPGLFKRLNQSVSDRWEVELQEALTATQQSAPVKREVIAKALTAAVAEIDRALEDLNLTTRERLLLEASAYNVYALRSELLQVIGDLSTSETQTQALQQCSRIVDSVARGSDLHLTLALATSQRVAMQYGPQSIEARREQLAVAAAHTARYGPLPLDLLRQLIEVRRPLALGSWMGQRLGVLALDMQRSTGANEEAGADVMP